MIKKQYKGPQTPGNNTPSSYTLKIAKAVINACANTGILPSVVIGIALKESGSGNDYKAAIFNNPFGHRAFNSWSGVGVKLSTKPSAPYWRAYPTINDGIVAQVQILRQGKFKFHGVALKKTPITQLNAIQAAGYNVGPDKNQYAGKINGIINQYDLQQYDKKMMALERSSNDNNLAFVEQDDITRTLHSLLA